MVEIFPFVAGRNRLQSIAKSRQSADCRARWDCRRRDNVHVFLGRRQTDVHVGETVQYFLCAE